MLGGLIVVALLIVALVLTDALTSPSGLTKAPPTCSWCGTSENVRIHSNYNSMYRSQPLCPHCAGQLSCPSCLHVGEHHPSCEEL